MIERAEVARAEGLLPLGLLVGCVVQRPLKAGEPIRAGDVALDESQTIVRLRR